MMSFLLPEGLSGDEARELERAALAGGYDNTPAPTRVQVQQGRLTVRRDLDESGHLLVPWEVEGVGRMMNATATLMERDRPYHFQIELARGKVNQVRSQAADWQMVGLQTSSAFESVLRQATHAFGQAILSVPSGLQDAPPGPEADRHAKAALAVAYRSAEELIKLYVAQIFAARQERQPTLDTALGCRTPAVPPPAAEAEVLGAFNTLCLPFNWREIEPTESVYNWSAADALADWATARGVRMAAGPLIDFSPSGLPEWLLPWEGDLNSIASFMCDYVETAVARYRGRIRRWQICAGSNSAAVLGLAEDDLLRLTARLAEAAWQIDSQLELVIGLAQPWGDYMTSEDHTYSPFVFADTLLRAGLPFAGFELEWFMGFGPRGSYCRDLLESSRLLDLFALLGVPLQVSLGYPSSKLVDPLADPRQRVAGAGHWRGGFTPEAQADWAANFASLAVSKPHVAGVYWSHLSDAAPHLVPNGGLIDIRGNVKPALERLRALREEHLR